MDSVNSTTFIKRPPCMTDTQEKFLYTKELLSGRIFLGCYQERRYVTVLKDYRDVVYINNEETDLQQDIDKLRKKWLGVDVIKWVGITGPDSDGFPEAYCFWVKLTNLAFGHYWFQIKHVKLLEEEIFLQLKCIRKCQAPLTAMIPHVSEQEIFDNNNEKTKASTSICSSKPPVWDYSAKKIILSFQTACIDTLHNALPYLTWRNLVTVVKMTCALVLVMIMGIISLIGHLGEYLLKLIREFTFLINAFTPIVIHLIDFLTKIVGGLYILIAGMFYRNNNHPNIQPYRNNNLYSISYSNIIQGTTSQAPPPLDWRERNRLLRQELLSTSNKRN